MAPMKKVHRGLDITTPYTKGPDVEALQKWLNKKFEHFNIDRQILADGEFGPATLSACRQIAFVMGVTGKARRKLKRGRVSMSTQKLIRGRAKTPLEKALTVKRKPTRQKLRKLYDRSGGEKALAWAKKQIGTTESPYGANSDRGRGAFGTGPKIDKWITFTGYTGPVYWCGCFVCYAVVAIGKAKIPNRNRLGFDGYIKADSLGRVNGLVPVGFSEARAGDIVTFTFPHIGLVDHPHGDRLDSVDGNTNSDAGGTENNGGGVYSKTRSRSQVAAIARPNYP